MDVRDRIRIWNETKVTANAYPSQNAQKFWYVDNFQYRQTSQGITNVTL